MNGIRIVVDTNVLISALVFGGKLREILTLITKKELLGITSPFLISELTEILTKKFKFPPNKIHLTERKIKKSFKLVYPKESLNVIKHPTDNHVLETAVEGNCRYLVTGDKHLLELKSYRGIIILTPNEFLNP